VSYRVELRPAVERQLRALPRGAQQQLLAAVEALADSPRPSGTKALTGELTGSYRLKVGRVYRLGYDVDDAAQVVTVWGVGHRDKFYEKARRRRR
jgi:mRNA interferase RelE/StbE